MRPDVTPGIGVDDTTEPISSVGPDWVQEYLKEGGKIEDVSALMEWCTAHGIILETELSPVAKYAAGDGE